MRRRPQTQHHRPFPPRSDQIWAGGPGQGKRATSPTNRSGWGPALARGWVGTAQLVGDPAMGRGPVGHRPGAICLGGNKGTRASPTMRTLPPFSWHPPREPTHKDALKPL